MLRLASAVSAFGLAGFTIVLILSRFPVNFDHDWVESTLTRGIHRVMAGEGVYPAPSAEFVGDNYPPFYYYLCAALTPLFGNALLTARAVSVASTALVALALIRISSDRRQLTGPHNAPNGWDQLDRTVAPALLLGFYAASGQTFDLARVDMASLALASWAAVLALKSDTARSAILAGLLMALAILCKHNILLVGAAIGGGMLLFAPRRAVIFGVTALTIPAIIFLALNINTNGWSTYYLFEQVAQNDFGGRSRWIRFFAVDVGWHGVLLAGLLAAFMLAVWNGPVERPAFNRRRNLAVLFIAIGGLAMTISGRQKVGGFQNNLVPAWTFALFAIAWCLPRVRAMLGESPPSRRNLHAIAAYVALLAITVSLALTYRQLPIKRYLATSTRQAAAADLQRLVDDYAKAGPVWIPAHSGVVPNANAYAHLCPIGFTIDSPGFPARSMLQDDILAKLGNRHWSAIILDDPRDRFISQAVWNSLVRNYREVPWPLKHADHLLSLTGKITCPRRLFVRREGVRRPASSLREAPTGE